MSKRQKREVEEESESDIEEQEEDPEEEDDSEVDYEMVLQRWKQMNRGRKGECKICSKTIARKSAEEHVTKCLDSDEKTSKSYYLFKIEAGDYFLCVAVRPEITLKEMDEWIREQWLECCYHLSSFTITTPKKKRGSILDFAREEEKTFMSSLDKMSSRFNERDMEFPLSDIAKIGLFMRHIYDFGTSTTSTWTLVSQGNASFPEKLKVVAQNKEIKFPCVGKKNTCSKPATQIKTNGRPITWCDKCFDDGEEDEEDYLPIVNSPRVGECGYGA